MKLWSKMHTKRARDRILLVLGCIFLCNIQWSVAEERSILEGANVVGNNLAYWPYKSDNPLISESFGAF